MHQCHFSRSTKMLVNLPIISVDLLKYWGCDIAGLCLTIITKRSCQCRHLMVYQDTTERSRQSRHWSIELLQSGHVKVVTGLPSYYRAVTSMSSLVYRAITERSRQNDKPKCYWGKNKLKTWFPLTIFVLQFQLKNICKTIVYLVCIINYF